MKFFIYSRKSVYTGKGESIENQMEMCRQYIFSKFPDHTNADITVYEDEGFSAKNTARPQFQQMLRDMKTQKPDYVVCYRLDRISRSVSDFSSLIEDLNEREISFVCIKEEFDTAKPMGKAMMYIASVFAQLERETIAERVRDNMLMLARTGRWLGGTTPTGYASEKVREIIVDGRVKTACKLKDNPDELRAVDMMFEKYLELRSIAGVSKLLIKKGVTSRTGKYYSLLGVKEILQNPVYCIADQDALAYFRAQNADVCFDEGTCSDKLGLLAYNKRDYKKKHAPRQPMEKWIVAIGKHRGRVSGAKWAAVQSILSDNIPDGKKPAKMHNDYSLLSGMIICAQCGSRMFAKQRSGKGANTELYDYICSNKLRGGTALCSCQNLNGRQTDDLVCEYLMCYTDVGSDVYKLLEKLKRDVTEQVQKNPMDAVQERIAKCNAELDHLVRHLSQENVSGALASRINARAAALEGELAALRDEQARLQNENSRTTDRALEIDLLTGALSSLKTYFPQLSIHEKRTLVKLLVQRIVWDGGDLHIFLYGG
ncbi:MAG: recombinase family protein [Clostridia bacterium]|nr:recombinase family protein [Clostridia bacterium]